jgi:hypothetical protein
MAVVREARAAVDLRATPGIERRSSWTVDLVAALPPVLRGGGRARCYK